MGLSTDHPAISRGRVTGSLARAVDNGRGIRFLYLVLGVLVGAVGSVSALSATGMDRPSAICATSTAPLDFVSNPTYPPYDDWRPQGPGLDSPIWSDGTPHPGGMAQIGLRAANAGDRATAERMADGLMAMAEGGLLPYRFDLPAEHQVAPWFSAFTQGQALALMSRLGRLDDARVIAATLLRPSQLTKDGWFLEYPGQPVVYNGHLFAAFGLYEFWRATGDPAAKAAALRAFTVARATLPDVITTGGIWYDLGHGQRISPVYFAVLVDEFEWLRSITGDPCFDAAARAVLHGHG